MKRTALRDKTIQFVLFTSGMFLVCLPMFSQGNAGRILGTVTDQSGGLMAGARLTIIDTLRGVSRTLTADGAGEYNAFNVLNHPIFCNPNGAAGGANSTPADPSSQPFGTAASTPDVCSSNPEIGSGGPRSIQLGLKILF